MSELLAKSVMEGGRTLSLEKHLLDTEESAVSIFKRGSRFLENWLRFFKIDESLKDKFLLNLRVACLFHDIGKANEDFQKAIKEHGFQQAIRHEHLSALVLHLPEVREWLGQNRDLDIPIITSSVLCHHLKASGKNEHEHKWPAAPLRGLVILNLGDNQVRNILEKLNILVGQNLSIPNINYKTYRIEDVSWRKAIDLAVKESRMKLDSDRLQFHLALKAGLIVADSVASGLVREGHLIDVWVKSVLHSDSLKENEIFTEIIQKRMKDKKIHELHEFQKQVALKGDRVLLMAGCGMGKTLAAWNWANEVSKRRKISKVIFLYPTRGTATEGFKDYASWAPEADAALMHGTSDYELESMFTNPKDEKYKKNFGISEEDERLFALAFWSKRFFSATADQFLSFLQNHYKGICLLPVLSECALIVDEVHSFDKPMFASLLSFLKHFQIPILCMTATLTPKKKQSLLDQGLELYPKEEDRNDVELKELIRSENHPRYNKTILKNVEQAKDIAIKRFREGKRVLWVLNTVDRCQKMYDELTKELQTEVHCYHSRFKLQDRKTIHEKTIQAFQGESKKSIAVTTQVCEMSLDLDADVLISEIAPVSSLVQRFGRANRHLKKGLEFRAELYLYKPTGSLKPYNSNEIQIAEKFLNALPEKDISQFLLATLLEEYAEEEYKQKDYSAFVNMGYFALTESYRDDENEFTVQAILDKDLESILKILKENQKIKEEKKKGILSAKKEETIDKFVLPVPKGNTKNLRISKDGIDQYPLMPKYLWVVSEKFYSETKGFAP
jgi:CRISPR-associated endonuclease/helicase Cas3